MTKQLLKLVMGLAKPAPGAGARDVRRAGAIVFALGIGLLAFGAAVEVLLAAMHLGTPLLAVGLAGMVLGAYRAVLGVEPEAVPGQVNVKRLIFGVAFICGGGILLLAIVLALSYFSEKSRGRVP